VERRVTSVPLPWPNDAALHRSLTGLLRDLVRIPSRAGTDDYGAIFSCIAGWLAVRGVLSEILPANGSPIAMVAAWPDDREHPALLLNATVDTAGFGDAPEWRHPPLSAVIEDGWLYGRGSADSKAGVAIFCHLLVADKARGGRATALAAAFDADEHTGGFAGMRAVAERCPNPIAGVLIGYPGVDRIMAGARGVWRATVAVRGVAAHSGSSHGRGTNAVTRAATLVRALGQLHDQWQLLRAGDFPLPPKLTVTGIRGGGEFSMVPELCEVDVDVRLTPLLAATQAEAAVHAVVAEVVPDSAVVARVAWPPYRLPDDSPLVVALADAAQQVLGIRPPAAVAGPANVGNLLAQRGIPATCGFGVAYRNAHARDECVDLASLLPVFHTYALALQQLLGSVEER